TSPTVKKAMLHDLGSRETEFVEVVRGVQDRLLAMAGTSREHGFEAVLLAGSGTSGVEAVISSVVPRHGKLLVLVNGAYGKRIAKIAAVHRVPAVILENPTREPLRATAVEQKLAEDGEITHVALVHCETTTGILNPAAEIGRVVRAAGRDTVLDAMSSFGGIRCDVSELSCDYLISSANKCLGGVPGFSFVLCRRDKLLASAGIPRTLSLDLLAQWQQLEKNGQFRFTPPTHAILAFAQALRELEEEGGVEARARRFRENMSCLVKGMRNMGFREYLPEKLQSAIITTFYFPRDEHFHFEEFHSRIKERGCVIYPGKVPGEECFRIGTIGDLYPEDMQRLLTAIQETLDEMQITQV
ncbi:MAG: 2-aminoethylphosphonate--pyruvate transaminase, partial [Planctomycetota bacterium]